MVSNHPFHFTVDKVTHLMARSPYIKLARPLAFRKMKCVEQKANHICYDGYHEWGCTSHQKLPQHRIMGKRVKLDRIGWKKSRSGGGGWCTSQKEGKRRRMIRFFKIKSQNISRRKSSSKTRKARSDQAITIPNVSHPFCMTKRGRGRWNELEGGERQTYQQKPMLYAIHIAQTCEPSAQTSRNTGKGRRIFSDAKQIGERESAT